MDTSDLKDEAFETIGANQTVEVQWDAAQVGIVDSLFRFSR